MPLSAIKSRLSCLLMGALLVPAATARAQGDPRETAAKKACAAGRVDEGVEILAELFTQTNDVNYVYNQGRCYQQNGVHDKAALRFREYLRRSPDLAAGERQEVERFISEAEEQMRRRQANNEQRAPARAGLWRTASLGLGGLAAAAIGTGVVLSVKVSGAEQSLERDLAMRELDNTTVAKRYGDGARLETFQWVAYGVGAAALAGGVACYLIGVRPAREPAVAFTWTPAPVGRGFSTSMIVRY